MKLTKSSLMTINWDEKDYKIRKPKVLESMEFSKQWNKTKKDDSYALMLLTIDYLDKLGLPKAVTEEMEIEHVTAISNLLNGVSTEGK